MTGIDPKLTFVIVLAPEGVTVFVAKLHDHPRLPSAGGGLFIRQFDRTGMLQIVWRLAANRRNAQRGGRKPGSTTGTELSFRERCARRDEAHVQILEHIAEHSPNEGFRMTAIRDLWDRAHGRPRQAIEGSGPGGAIPFSVILPAALCDDET
jgi:hypothetical protein